MSDEYAVIESASKALKLELYASELAEDEPAATEGTEDISRL